MATPIDLDGILASYRATVAATKHGGGTEDFATLAAWLPALCEDVARLRGQVAMLRSELDQARGRVKGMEEGLALRAATDDGGRREREAAVIAAVREEINKTIWVDEGVIGVTPAEGMPKTETALAALDAAPDGATGGASS